MDLSTITRTQWSEFAQERQRVPQILREAFAATGLVMNADFAPDAATRCWAGSLKQDDGKDVAIGVGLFEALPELCLMVGVPVPTYEEARDFCLRGMQKHRIPFIPTKLEDGYNVEIRYPICLGFASTDTITRGINFLLSVLQWASTERPLIPYPHGTVEFQKTDGSSEASRMEKFLKDKRMNCRIARTGLDVWTVVYTTAKWPKTEFGIICDSNRPDRVSVGGTSLSTNAPLTPEQEQKLFELCRLHSVSFEFKKDGGLLFGYIMPVGEMEGDGPTTAVIKPSVATMNALELLAL